ncbi:DUF6114 domain-containing protein [Halorientalis pallida]|uniref:Uncharacterized protein n=1 Tax=Halorientalis pallida TaxID=2479928 RepID=A0A498KWE4_9EURY|nr:DUF6114 domain-containing protein [Halorientalis pallida]RXK46196.1 hypothetical protein EAF64_20440 [Halorientalis pallida]
MSSSRGPIAGPFVVVLAGVVVAAVPVLFGDVLAVFGADSAPSVGLGIGGALVLVGVAAHLQPSFTTELGAVAIVLSLLSVFGALGGFLVGLLLGVVGGSLCVAWKPSAG